MQEREGASLDYFFLQKVSMLGLMNDDDDDDDDDEDEDEDEDEDGGGDG